MSPMVASRKRVLQVFALAVLCKIALKQYEFFGYGINLSDLVNDKGCRLEAPDGLIGSEDIVLGKHQTLFVSSGDLHNVFNHGVERAAPGAIWWAQAGSSASAFTLQRVVLVGFGSSVFQPHGIMVSNSTDRLYAVNHGASSSSVEIFDIRYGESSGNGSDRIAPTLHHAYSVRSPLFPLRALNDVVEADVGGEHFFVTTWLPFAMPAAGKKHVTGWREGAGVLGNLLAQLAGLRLTLVLRCDLKGACADAGAGRFAGANGITISSDRSLLFVNDPPLAQITVLSHDAASGQLGLTESTQFSTKFCADNVEWVDGHILVGMIPQPYKYVQNDLLGTSHPVAGGMGIAKQDAGSGKWIMNERVLTHDGSKLSQISAAARFASTVYMGSPFSKGLLVCET